MKLKSKKVLMVVSPINFRDQEYSDPKEVFESSGLAVKVASIQGGVAEGVEGTEVKIDLTVSQVNVDDFDAVVFIGGPGMAEIVGDESLQILASRFFKEGKLTAAICVAPSILARAGILSGKKATSWSGAQEDLISNGANFTGEPVTVDGNIITADGPESASDFGEKIVEALE